MAKETYYFSHDYDPLSDPKLLALVGEHGAAGYGIYWRIVEMLHSDDDHKLEHERYIYAAIAKQMSTSREEVESIISYSIEVCKLFVSDGSYFWSERVFRNMDKREEIRDKRRKAGLASAEARKGPTTQQEIAFDQQVSTPVEHVLPTEKPKQQATKEVPNYKKMLLSKINVDAFSDINREYYDIAIAFYELFRKNLIESGAKTTNIDKSKGTSIDDIRLLIEADKYSIDDLRDVHSFLQRNDFWKKNILSTSKLREKMDKLKMEVSNEKTKGNRGTHPATGWDQLKNVVDNHFSR